MKDAFWQQGGGGRHWPHELCCDLTQRYAHSVQVFGLVIKHLRAGKCDLYKFDPSAFRAALPQGSVRPLSPHPARAPSAAPAVRRCQRRPCSLYMVFLISLNHHSVLDWFKP